MGKLPRLTPREAEEILPKARFEMVRSKGSHRIYLRGNRKVIEETE